MEWHYYPPLSTVYGGEISGDSGQIASPLYPNMYPHNADYAWTITVASDNYIRISFDEFDIENGGVNCVFDHLRVSGVLKFKCLYFKMDIHLKNMGMAPFFTAVLCVMIS